MTTRLTAIIQWEEDGYVALCPELDVASQGLSVCEARENLREALELFYEVASDATPAESDQRLDRLGSVRPASRYAQHACKTRSDSSPSSC